MTNDLKKDTIKEDIENSDKIKLDLKAIKMNLDKKMTKPRILFYRDENGPKISLINSYIDIKGPDNKSMNFGLKELEKFVKIKHKNCMKSYVNINTNDFYIDMNSIDKLLYELKQKDGKDKKEDGKGEKNKKEDEKDEGKVDEEEIDDEKSKSLEDEREERDIEKDEDDKKEGKKDDEDNKKMEGKEEEKDDKKSERLEDKREERDISRDEDDKKEGKKDDEENKKMEGKEEEKNEKSIELKNLKEIDDNKERIDDNIEKIVKIKFYSPYKNSDDYNKIDEEIRENGFLFIIDISGQGVKTILNNLKQNVCSKKKDKDKIKANIIEEDKEKNIPIFNVAINTMEIIENDIKFNSLATNLYNYNKHMIENNNANEDDKIKYRKKEIYIESKQRRPYTNNDEKIKYMIEDMCVLGSLTKKEILEEKKNNPEKFITIQEATKNNKNIDETFCIGLLAFNLENMGITTAIEKNPSKDEESIYEKNAVLKFITNGLIEKEKYTFHFDLGEEKNNELLYNKEEQEKFNKKLIKKLSIEYNIPEEKVLVMNPQRGSYQVDLILLSEEFNTNINIDEFKEKCKNDNEFKELSYLKEIHKNLIMEGCKLSIDMLDSRGNKVNGWSVGQKRGGYDYYPPIKGWKGFGLKVLDKYDDGNNDWLGNNGNKKEWAVAYHGTGVKLGSNFTLEKATNNIIKGGFKPGWGQAYAQEDDANHPGKKIGIGVYCSPNPYVMESYASCAQSSTNINGINFMMGFMMRVKPDKIRYANSQKDYWVLNGTTDEMRPYRIMIKAQGVEDENGYLTYIDAMNRRNNIGSIYYYNIKGSDSGTVWGYHIYTDDSNIAQAAVIEGKCKMGEEKVVGIKMIEPKSSYQSITINGLYSQSWGYWDGSYIFI